MHDANGKTFITAGTRVNPLSIVTLHSALAFYDSDDNEEVTWAKKVNKKYKNKIKFILVNGSISSQSKLLHQPIYFDQAGKLTHKFHIEHVPALVYQQGLTLKIEEVIP